MSIETMTCPSCKEEMEYDTETGEGGQWSSLYEEEVCEGCYDDPYPSAMHRFNAVGHDFLSFGDASCDAKHTDTDGVEEYDDNDGYFPEWFTELWKEGHRWDGRPYKHTDGWRGYYDTDQMLDFENKLVKVEDGWVTGYPDETTRRKADFHDLFERLVELSEAGEIPEGVTLFVLFEPTSNVFSTACGISCPKAEEEAVRSFLRTAFGETVEKELHHQLG